MTLGIDPADFREKIRAFLRRHTLNALWLIQQGKNTQRGIAKELKADVTRISRILVYLEAEGYVVSEPIRNRYSGRPQKRYRLAQKGEALLQAVRAINEISTSE